MLKIAKKGYSPPALFSVKFCKVLGQNPLYPYLAQLQKRTVVVKLQPPKPVFQITLIQDTFCKSIVRGFQGRYFLNNNEYIRLIVTKRLKFPQTCTLMNQTFQLPISGQKAGSTELLFKKILLKNISYALQEGDIKFSDEEY